MKLMRKLLISTFALLLAGCAGLGPQESVEGPGNVEDWKAHKAHISEIDGWQISGKIGIQAPQDSGSGTLFWLQRQGYFDIRLSGPLGRGATRPGGAARRSSKFNPFTRGWIDIIRQLCSTLLVPSRMTSATAGRPHP